MHFFFLNSIKVLVTRKLILMSSKKVLGLCINHYSIFYQSLQNGIFPDEVEIVRVTSLFKKGSDSDLWNYQPKVLEKFIYNSLYKHLNEKKKTLQKTVWISTNALRTMAHHQIKILFEKTNCELGKINQWFKANRLSLDVGKINYTLFHKRYIWKIARYGKWTLVFEIYGVFLE